MNAVSTSALVFGCLFSSAGIGVLLRRALPQHHLGSDAKDAVKLAMGLVATMTALVLGLLVAALSVAGSSFLILELDRPFSGLIQISSEPLRQALAATEE